MTETTLPDAFGYICLALYGVVIVGMIYEWIKRRKPLSGRKRRAF